MYNNIGNDDYIIIKNSALKSLFLIFISIVLATFSINFLSADVISLNSGGSTNLSVSPNEYIEGFFFGIEELATTPVCGNSVIETGETCDDGNTVSGDGCSSTCQIEVPGGGGGGGGGTTINIKVEPAELNVNLEVNTNVEKIITITNLGSSSATVKISQEGLDNLVILSNTSLTIPARGKIELKVIFVGPSEPGIYTGKIKIGTLSVLVSLNIKTKFLLFDSNIVVLNANYTVRQGEQLKTLINIIPIGDPERLDVTLNFIIKDYANKIYLTKTETLLVENQTNLKRNFDTGNLPTGDYVVGLELVYPNGVAPSSANFKVTGRAITSVLGRIVLFLIIMILIILIMILIILIIKKLRQKRRERMIGISSEQNI